MTGPGSQDATPLREALAAAARVPILLVACDFDGTLSPIAPVPDQARADGEAMRALSDLALTPHTHAAVISGRSLTQLRTLTGSPRKVLLVGSHGAEPGDREVCLTVGEEDALRVIQAELEAIASSAPGFLLERKPAGFAFHYRRAGEEGAHAATAAVLSGPAKREGVFVVHGNKVIELSLVRPDKGGAMWAARVRAGASAAVFIGDDTTDEEAFGALLPGDVGVRVGPGETAAKFRIETQGEVAGLLAQLSAMRRAALEQARPTAIERHSILSDQRTVAVADPRGRIVWLCVPRVDAGAMFAQLLGGPGAGFFAIEPASPAGEPRQEYSGDSFVLRTEWDGLTVTDYFDCSAGRPYQRAGRTDLVRVVEGTGRTVIRFAPRLDFGRLATRLVVREGGLEVDGCPDPIVLHAPGVVWTITEDGQHQTATAEIELTGPGLVFELRYGVGNLRPGVLKEAERRKQTERFWSGWAGTLRLPPLLAPQVKRSALVLKALCHGPTGAIIAAGTMSLPAPLGGIRNWDYRYCWPRDACLAAAALIRLGNTGTAMKLLDWLVGVVDSLESPERLRPIYTVSGGHLAPEAELGTLAGYGNSRPVRVGNAAANQVQLDVFGPIVDVVALLSEAGAPITPQYWRLVEAMVRAVAARWEEPDHGIWELRTHKRHHVHTKVMCWHAVNRGMAVAEQMLGRSKPEWSALRDRIEADVLAHGWNAGVGAFTSAYGERSLDAATLQIGLTGLLPPDDPRFIGTVEAVSRELRSGDAVYRYRYDDGLPGLEGGFNLCTSWLIESLAVIGRRDEARAMLERYAALAGPTGLMSEQFDPETGLALGNFPQAYSHLGLINAAVRLSGGA